MASLNEKLAESLIQLKRLQENHILVVNSGELTRTHQERLVANGFLQEIMKGWYVISRPEDRTGRCLRNNLCSSIPEIRQYRINLLFAHLWEGTINKILSMRKVYLF